MSKKKPPLYTVYMEKVKVVPVVIGVLGAVTPKLDAWLQEIPEPEELSARNS